MDAGAWPPLLADAGLARLAALPDLVSQDVEQLVARVARDRVGVLSALKRAGVSKLADRQTLAGALGRRPRQLAAAAAEATVDAASRPRVPLVVSINVHEKPRFVLRQLSHIGENLPAGQFVVVLNCNAELHAALRPLLPDAYAYECNGGGGGLAAGAAAQRVVVHPQPLAKRRFHGSILRGVMRNMDYACRRWDFEAFLVLSSRSWFRRPLTLSELREAKTPVPPGVSRAHFRHVDAGEEGGAAYPAYVDASDAPIGFELGTGASGVMELRGHDWAPLLRTRLAQDVLKPGTPGGSPMLQGPHEGLLLEAAACRHALTVLDGCPGEIAMAGWVGDDLYEAEAAVEEFALQSLAHSRGYRFAQLSDFGPRDDGLDAPPGEHATPITKVERVEPPCAEEAGIASVEPG